MVIKESFKIIVCVCFILNSALLSCQNIDSLQQDNQSYFKADRESIFVHLNKSDFITGESIWFKGYIYNRHKKLPFIRANNIYVGIYNNFGDELKTKLFDGRNGMFNGSFEIDSTYTSGDYYLKASSKWMDNFKESDCFIQPIKIINSIISNPKTDVLAYDIHVLPEGGHIVASIKNTVGYKINDQYGQGVIAKSVALKDESNTLITESKPNLFGIGKLVYTPQKDAVYKLYITLDTNEIITHKMPKAKPQGIAINVNTSLPDDVIVSLKTNLLTITNSLSNTYYLLVHKDGQSMKYEVTFSEDKPEHLIAFKKTNLFAGINILTLFDYSGKPLIERLIFNHNKIEFPEIKLTQLKTESDSLVFELEVNSKNSSYKNVSLTALPFDTKSLNFKKDIYTEFHLKPYTKGIIENPGYYFQNINRRKRYDLDLLLLTQGWSRYDWQDVFTNPPKIKSPNENGISFTGNVYNIQKNYTKQLMLYPTQNIPAGLIAINTNNNGFSLNNLFVYEGDSIQLSILTNKGEAVKPAISFINNSKTLPVNIKDDIPNIRNVVILSDRISSERTEYKIPEGFLGKNIQELSEVIITAKKTNDINITKKKKYNVNSFLSEDAFDITQKTIETHGNSIMSYLRSQGFKIKYEGIARRPVVYARFRGPSTIRGENPDVPLIFIDNVPITDGRLDEALGGDLLSNLESIIVSRNGLTYGSRGANGVIKIITLKGKKGEDNSPDFVDNNILIKPVEFGFSRPKKFFTPRYSGYDNPLFRDYGVIHWLPNIEIFNSSKTQFKIFNTLQKSIIFYVQGFDEKGNLISGLKTIDL